MVLRWVGSLTMVALGLSVALAITRSYAHPIDTTDIDRLLDVCIGLVEAGFGAIVGLLGGKNL